MRYNATELTLGRDTASIYKLPPFLARKRSPVFINAIIIEYYKSADFKGCVLIFMVSMITFTFRNIPLQETVVTRRTTLI